MSHEQKIKCKLLKVSSAFSYEDEQVLIEDISEFEELTYEEFQALTRWVDKRKRNFVLIQPIAEKHIRTAIKDQIAAEEERARELEIKRLEREKVEKEQARLRAKVAKEQARLREAKKIERAKKKLEELSKLVSQHENSISNDQKP